MQCLLEPYLQGSVSQMRKAMALWGGVGAREVCPVGWLGGMEWNESWM